jgi:hypothetical protein
VRDCKTRKLSYGLIGSAATLCAVFLGLRKFQLAEQRREQTERRREKLEQDCIQRVVAYCSRLLEPFDELPGNDDINFADRLDRFFATGKFWHISFGSVPIEYRVDAHHVRVRLKALNKVQKKSRVEAGTDLNQINQINEYIREVVIYAWIPRWRSKGPRRSKDFRIGVRQTANLV